MHYINDRDKLLALLKQNLSEEKYIHSLATEKRAVKMAEIFGADTYKAGFAGLIHDITKCMDDVALAEEYGITGYSSVKTLHQMTGAIYIKKHGITDDEDIINAVLTHTTGSDNMTDLQKIVYLADATEENRKYPEAVKLRELADRDLDEAMLFSLTKTIELLKKRQLPIDERTLLAYNSIKDKNEEGAK